MLLNTGTIIGIIACEWRSMVNIDREVQVLTGLADALGVAVDNANLFKSLRLGGANDERRRIARELHDRTGSTLAFVGFELDRLSRKSTDTEQVRELRLENSLLQYPHTKIYSSSAHLDHVQIQLLLHLLMNPFFRWIRNRYFLPK